MINKSHFLGARHGMERIMGLDDTPVRRLFNYSAEKFLAKLPILYVLTVMAKNPESGDGHEGRIITTNQNPINKSYKNQSVHLILGNSHGILPDHLYSVRPL